MSLMHGRSKSPFISMVTARTLNDGKTWRKYGQKYIHASTNPRYIYVFSVVLQINLEGKGKNEVV